MRIIFPRVETLRFHESYDGGAKYIDYLSQYLVKEGIDVTIITTKTKNKELKEKYENGVKYVFLPPKYKDRRGIKINMPYKLLFSYQLKRYLEKEDFDVLHNTEMFAYFYLHKKSRNPVITQSFGLEPFYGPETLAQKGLRKLYVKLFLQIPWLFCLKESEKVLSEGEFQKGDLEKIGINQSKIFPLPNGIYLEGIEKMRKGRKDKKKELGMGKRDLLVLNVNQISEDKRVEDVVEAFSLIKKDFKKAKLVIIGKGPLEDKIKHMIKSLNLEDSVIMLKNIPEKDLYDYYFSSDIFVNASIQKDFIMSIQEAMACGLPIVSSNQPFLVEEGVNGFVVGPKNPRGIAEAVLKIYRGKKRNKMGKESKKMAKQYDYRNIVKIAIKEYKKLRDPGNGFRGP